MIGNTIFIEFNQYLDYKDIIRTIHTNENIINIVFQFFSTELIEKEGCKKIEDFFDNLPYHTETINIIINNTHHYSKLNKVYLNNLPVTIKKVFISNKLVKVKKIPFDCKVIYLNTGKPNQDYDKFISTIKPIN